MSKKQEELTASEKMKASVVFEKFENFSRLLNVYLDFQKVRSTNYLIQRELNDFECAIGALESQLEDLIDKLKVFELSE